MTRLHGAHISSPHQIPAPYSYPDSRLSLEYAYAGQPLPICEPSHPISARQALNRHWGTETHDFIARFRSRSCAKAAPLFVLITPNTLFRLTKILHLWQHHDTLLICCQPTPCSMLEALRALPPDILHFRIRCFRSGNSDSGNSEARHRSCWWFARGHVPTVC